MSQNAHLKLDKFVDSWFVLIKVEWNEFKNKVNAWFNLKKNNVDTCNVNNIKKNKVDDRPTVGRSNTE